PYLLAVDDEVVVAQLGARGEPGEVAPRARLAHAEAPGDLGPQGRHRPALPLLLGAEVDDRRCADREALRVERAGNPALGELLEVDHLLDRSGVTTAQLRRPTGHEPAGIEQPPLPRLGPVGKVGARQLRLAHLDGRRRVGVEPAGELVAERLGAFVVGQPHCPHDTVRTEMDFEFSPEQNAVRETIRRFLADKAPIAYVREMYDDERGTADAVWKGL